MYKIALLNMPFSNLGLPSIALTQLQSVLKTKFQDKVDINIHYLNLEFADFLGFDTNDAITNSIYSLNSGIGDWIFRNSAFPNSPNNDDEYERRYFNQPSDEQTLISNSIKVHRPKFDTHLNFLIDKYELDKVDVVGFTSMFSQSVASFAMARQLKKRNPDIITIIGGANCEAPMGQEIAKNVDAIDYVFSGPALINFPQFIEYCINGELDMCTRIRGVITKNNAPMLMMTETTGEELSIDEEVELDYEPFLDMIEKSFAQDKLSVWLPFESSRGCWWGEKAHCTFCGLNGQSMKYRAMDSEKAIKLIEKLASYWPRVTRLEAVDNILPKNYVESVFPKLNIPAEMDIFYEVRADLSANDLNVLSKAGVRVVQPGIESLATSTLKLMKKGTTSFNNLVFLKNCLLNNVAPAWNILVGFPGESADVFDKYILDIPKLTHLPAPTGAYPVRFDRFSPYFTQAKEYKLKLSPLAFYEMVYPFDTDSLARFAYFFEDKNYHSDYIQTMIQNIVPLTESVQAWQERWVDNNNKYITPQLYVRTESNASIVYDSRGSEVFEYEVDEIKIEILNILNRRKGIAELKTTLNSNFGINELEASKHIEFLISKGLLFEEGARLMSLVLTIEPKELYSDFSNKSKIALNSEHLSAAT